jgi:hypothetical protein
LRRVGIHCNTPAKMDKDCGTLLVEKYLKMEIKYYEGDYQVV